MKSRDREKREYTDVRVCEREKEKGEEEREREG